MLRLFVSTSLETHRFRFDLQVYVSCNTLSGMTLLEKEKQLSITFRPGTWWQTYSQSHSWETYTGSLLKPWDYGYTQVGVTVFNHEPHSGSSGSEFPAPFQTQKGQRHFSNDWNCFWKVLVPFWTRNCQKHFNHLTISYVCLNLWLPFVTASITIYVL